MKIKHEPVEDWVDRVGKQYHNKPKPRTMHNAWWILLPILIALALMLWLFGSCERVCEPMLIEVTNQKCEGMLTVTEMASEVIIYLGPIYLQTIEVSVGGFNRYAVMLECISPQNGVTDTDTMIVIITDKSVQVHITFTDPPE